MMKTPPPTVTDAVILMAGAGSRLGVADGALAKPLVQIAGRPLISYTLEALEAAGVRVVHVVLGAKSERITAEIVKLLPAGMELKPITNPNWRKQNGVSVLCAEGRVKIPFVLAMGDHLFGRSILSDLLQKGEPQCLNLAIDRKIASIFDLDDAMKVQTIGDRVVALSKTLETYDAIDTGLFLCPNELFDSLRRAQRDGDCSLVDGVRLMAAEGKVCAIDIGSALWQDVDTPGMRANAEAMFSAIRGVC